MVPSSGGSEVVGCRLAPVPGEEIVETGSWVIGDPAEHVCEPGIDLVELCRLYERVHRCGALAAAVIVGEEPRLSAKRNPPYRSLGGIVGETDSAVVEKAGECHPALEHVIHRFGDIGMSGEPSAVGTHPAFEFSDQRFGARAPCSETLIDGAAIDLALDGEDGVDAAHGFDREWRLSDIGEDEELAPGMCPTRGLDDRTVKRQGLNQSHIDLAAVL
jgi:hypothetical protein